MKISVIIPMLNESNLLPKLVLSMVQFQNSESEVIFVDGGSQDASVRIVENAGFSVVATAPGRAIQMNAGAANAKGDVLLFLHADTALPANALDLIFRAIEQGGVWGHFDVTILGKSKWLKMISFMMNWRARLTGVATGDQCLFVLRSAFNHIDGFAEIPIMEDVELSKRLKKIYAPVCISERVSTSGRRWETRGIWRTIFLMWRLRWQYWRGVSVDEIAASYR